MSLCMDGNEFSLEMKGEKKRTSLGPLLGSDEEISNVCVAKGASVR